jgi:hypothetical protein
MTITRFLNPEKTAKETGAKQSDELVHVGLYDADASPESARRRTSPPTDFDSLPDIEALARAQGVSSNTSFEELLGDFWPEDESVEDFLAARERWRRERCNLDD